MTAITTPQSIDGNFEQLASSVGQHPRWLGHTNNPDHRGVPATRPKASARSGLVLPIQLSSRFRVTHTYAKAVGKTYDIADDDSLVDNAGVKICKREYKITRGFTGRYIP